MRQEVLWIGAQFEADLGFVQRRGTTLLATRGDWEPRPNGEVVREFQFGVDYSPAVRGGAPFFAWYGNLRQELDYGGFFVVQAGWQWRGGAALRTFRIGAQYINGKSSQYEFFNDFEQHGSFGIWYDF